MALRHAYRDNAGVLTEITSKVRSLTLDNTVNAEEGSLASWQVQIDDPTGTFEIRTHRIYFCWEDTATGDDDVVAIGYTQRLTYRRGDLIEGLPIGGRVITVDIADINTVLGRRIMTGSDANRPAETDVQRVVWLEATTEGELIDDTSLLSTANPVDMDAADLRGKTFLEILQSCAEISGKNYFLTWIQIGADVMTGVYFSLFYDSPTSATAYASTARLTNVAADVDDTTTYIVAEADLIRDGERVYSGAYNAWDGGATYTELTATATAFARRDMMAPSADIKSSAKATAANNRWLADLDEEDDRLQLTFNMRPADVNRIKAGQIITGKFSHLPGYTTTYRPLRMLNRQVTQSQDETGFTFYRIAGDFSGALTAPSLVQFVEAPNEGIFTQTAILPSTPGTGDGLIAIFIQKESGGTLTKAGWTTVAAVNIWGIGSRMVMLLRNVGQDALDPDADAGTVRFDGGANQSNLLVFEWGQGLTLDGSATSGQALMANPVLTGTVSPSGSGPVLAMAVVGTNASASANPLRAVGGTFTGLVDSNVSSGYDPCFVIGYDSDAVAIASYQMSVESIGSPFGEKAAGIIALFV